MTAKQAVRQARRKAVAPFDILDTVQETERYFIISFRDAKNTEVTGGEIPLLFAVDKYTGAVRPMFPPEPADLKLLAEAEEVEK